MPYGIWDKQLEANRRWRKNKLRRLKLELGGKCRNCDSKNIDDLVFDHILPSTKIGNISHLIGYGKKILEKELEKCQLLCNSCHKEKTKKEKSISQHGTSAMYKRCGPPVCKDCKRYNRDKSRNYRHTLKM